MLSDEQVKSLKEQILKQIDSWIASPEKKQEAKKYVMSLNASQLEEFLIKNKMIKTQEQEKPIQAQQKQEKHQCPFCLIAEGKIPSYKIDENKSSLAILEINPLSKGHALIIPKKHKKLEKIPSQGFTLAKKISSKIKRKLKAKEISIQTAELFEHGAINVIPVYEDETLNKKHATEQELKELQEILKTKPKKIVAIKAKKTKELEKAPRRIP